MQGASGDTYRGMLPDEMFDDEDNVRLPDWYNLNAAARWLGMSAPALDALPEPERTFWLQRGLTAHNAEAEAWNINHPKTSG